VWIGDVIPGARGHLLHHHRLHRIVGLLAMTRPSDHQRHPKQIPMPFTEVRFEPRRHLAPLTTAIASSGTAHQCPFALASTARLTTASKADRVGPTSLVSRNGKTGKGSPRYRAC